MDSSEKPAPAVAVEFGVWAAGGVPAVELARDRAPPTGVFRCWMAHSSFWIVSLNSLFFAGSEDSRMDLVSGLQILELSASEQ